MAKASSSSAIVPVASSAYPATTGSSFMAATKASATATTASDFNPEPSGRRKQASVVEMLDYVKGLGIDPVAEDNMLWIAEEAFNAALPPGWSEHQDDEGRVYFHDSAKGESTWRHPMDDLFRDIVKYQRQVIRCGGFWEVEDTIAGIEDEIRKGLADWMELYDENGEKFFYDRSKDESRFDDPRMEVYHKLYARIKMVAKMKERLPEQARAQRPAEPTEMEKDRERRRLEEEDQYHLKVIKVQSMARMIIAKRRVRLALAHGVITKGPQPLLHAVQLRLERADGGAKELVLAQTTGHRRDRAATKIQARVRGMRARKRFRPLVLHRAHLSRIITRVQSRARMWLARRRVRRKRVERREKAATDIERVFRGFRDRQYVSALKAEKSRFDKLIESVLDIQKGMRMVLAYRERMRRRKLRLGASAEQFQRWSKVFLAKQKVYEICLVEEPIQAVFTITKDPAAAQVCPWSMEIHAAPWVSGGSRAGYSNRKGNGYLNLSRAECASNYKYLAARRIQATARGMASRKRVEFLRLLSGGYVDRIIEDTVRLAALRRTAAVKIQKVWRGSAVRRQKLLQKKYQAYLKKQSFKVKTLQAQFRTFAAQVWLQHAMEGGRANMAATHIQAIWRGWLARRHAERLREEALWPMKGWFEYTATGPDYVQVEVRFLLNPTFDDYRFFLEHGADENLDDTLNDIDASLGVCLSSLEGMGGTLGEVTHLKPPPPEETKGGGKGKAAKPPVAPSSKSAAKASAKSVGAPKANPTPSLRLSSKRSSAEDAASGKPSRSSSARQDSPARQNSQRESSSSVSSGRAGSKLPGALDAVPEASKVPQTPPLDAEPAKKRDSKAAPAPERKPSRVSDAAEAAETEATATKAGSKTTTAAKAPSPAVVADPGTSVQAPTSKEPVAADATSKVERVDSKKKRGSQDKVPQAAPVDEPSNTSQSKGDGEQKASTDIHMMETKKPDKGRKKSPPKEHKKMVEESVPSMASTILRVAPKLYKDKQEQEKEEKGQAEGLPEGKTGKDSPQPPSSKRHAQPSPPPSSNVKQMQAAGIRQGAGPQDATKGPQDAANTTGADATQGVDATLGADVTQVAPTAAAKQITKRSTYGGTLEGNKFHKSSKEVEHMSAAEKQAILIDIEADQQKKKIQIAKKHKVQKEKAKKERESQLEKYESQMSEVNTQESDRKQKKVEELKRWLKKKEAESKAKKERDEEMLQQLMEKEAQKSERTKLEEERRLLEREKRLREAEKKKRRLESQLLESRRAASSASSSLMQPTQPSLGDGAGQTYPGMQHHMSAPQLRPPGDMLAGIPGTMPMGMSMAPTGDATQRVLHRHIHHHVHYHDGQEAGSQGDGQGEISDDDHRKLELASEARVRAKLEASQMTPLGMFGTLGVDSAAATPQMRRVMRMPASDMQRTQEAFQKSPSLPQLATHHPRPGQLLPGQLAAYNRNVEQAVASYADSVPAKYARRGHGSSQMKGGGLAPPPH